MSEIPNHTDSAKLHQRERSSEATATPVPAPCEALRQRLIHMLMMARVVEGEYTEYEQTPESFRGRVLADMQDHVTELRKQIKLARAAVPGVAQFIDPLRHEPAGQWTMELNKSLADLETLLISDGYRVFQLHPNPWKKALRRLDERQRYLAVVDYSAPQPAPPTGGARDGDYKPASWFKDNTRVPLDRLRHAAQPDRKTMRVRKMTIHGVECYSVTDAQRWWSNDMRPRESA